MARYEVTVTLTVEADPTALRAEILGLPMGLGDQESKDRIFASRMTGDAARDTIATAALGGAIRGIQEAYPDAGIGSTERSAKLLDD